MPSAKNKISSQEKLTIFIGRDFSDDFDKLAENPAYQDEMPDNAIYFKDMKQLSSILTERKMELFEYVQENFPKKVKEISIELHRKDEAVSRDLKELEKFGLIEIERKGNRAYPRAKFKKIEIRL